MSVAENFYRIRKELPADVKIVAAVKTRSAEEARAVIEAGLTDIGHNYVQEAEAMFEPLADLKEKVKWHMIGNLQKNKINKALKIFDVIQTVDSLKNAQDIQSRALAMDKKVEVLLEINAGEESSKAGLAPEIKKLESIITDFKNFSHLKLVGIMTMGPFWGDPEALRPFFRATKTIYDQVKQIDAENVDLKTLSMGMSDSFKVAVEEGSNMVRLGTILFGQREYH
ncbi:MAG: YggS family pyridoxal phosphate-dependent enzyme [Spirochaetes bacterium]|nr:YggS family pyridoxal phosphate-dependent enzyme [Spirochaetota bacterium]